MNPRIFGQVHPRQFYLYIAVIRGILPPLKKSEINSLRNTRFTLKNKQQVRFYSNLWILRSFCEYMRFWLQVVVPPKGREYQARVAEGVVLFGLVGILLSCLIEVSKLTSLFYSKVCSSFCFPIFVNTATVLTFGQPILGNYTKILL